MFHFAEIALKVKGEKLTIVEVLLDSSVKVRDTEGNEFDTSAYSLIL